MREQQRLLESELSHWTGFSWEIQHGGKHTKIVLENGERKRTCPFSLTPVCRRSMLNNVTQLRRALADVGATRKGKR